jgi:non-homologous end joining protein Ku
MSMGPGPGMPGEGQPQAQAVPVKRVDALDLFKLLRKSLDKKASGQKQKNALE